MNVPSQSRALGIMRLPLPKIFCGSRYCLTARRRPSPGDEMVRSRNCFLIFPTAQTIQLQTIHQFYTKKVQNAISINLVRQPPAIFTGKSATVWAVCMLDSLPTTSATGDEPGAWMAQSIIFWCSTIQYSSVQIMDWLCGQVLENDSQTFRHFVSIRCNFICGLSDVKIKTFIHSFIHNTCPD